jgi:hypothetical protein
MTLGNTLEDLALLSIAARKPIRRTVCRLKGRLNNALQAATKTGTRLSARVVMQRRATAP